MKIIELDFPREIRKKKNRDVLTLSQQPVPLLFENGLVQCH